MAPAFFSKANLDRQPAASDSSSAAHPERANDADSPRNRHARELFAPLADDYDRWSSWLSFGQDPRWRRAMVDGMDLEPGALVADVATGTGAVALLLRERGCEVVAVDQSPEMLARAAKRGFDTIRARAEALPFEDAAFDGLTFTYLLRYVDDPPACLRELARVLKPGAMLGMVEFGVPRGVWQPFWRLYTRLALPGIGGLISPGWREAGAFLGPSILEFHRRYPGDALERLWQEAGFVDVRRQEMSLGGGLVMWARQR